MAKINGKWWSKEDIDKINEFITNSGKEKGIQEAAAYFKVTTTSIRSRLWKSEHGLHTKYISKNKKTNKVPIVKRKYTKNKVTSSRVEESMTVSTGNTISLDIKDVKLDLKNGKIVIVY